MPSRAFPSQSKRGFEVIVAKEDDVSLTRLLRDSFSHLETLAVDFRTKNLEIIESLADAPKYSPIYIISPDPGDGSVERLRTAVLFCNDLRNDVFHASLPRRHALYHSFYGTHPFTTKLRGQGLPVEMMAKGGYSFTYDCNGVESTDSPTRCSLLSKVLVSRFAIVDAETGEFVGESGPCFRLKVGPGALDSCRNNRHRSIGVGGMRDEETRLFLAPLPPEGFRELKQRRRCPNREGLLFPQA